MPSEKLAKIKAQAQKEIAEEDFRKHVDAAKEKIRSHRPFWSRVFPYRISVTRRDS